MAETTNNIPDLPTVAEAPATLSGVIDLASKADARAKAFANRTMARLRSDIDREREKIEARYDGVGISPVIKKQAIDKELDKHRREVVKSSEAERARALKELSAMRAAADASEALFASPQVMLSQEGLGTDKRSRYLEQLKGAGPAELRTHAVLAINRSDRELGAAVLTLLDRMTRRERPFSAAPLAERLVGRDFARAQEMIAIVRSRLDGAAAANRALERGCTMTTDKIAIGLAKRDEAKLRERVDA